MNIVRKFKKSFYFPVATYFKFFATMRLRMWKPKVIVVTGSNGKTTLLHLLEAQIGTRAKYSHLANSSFGIPFDILGIKRTSLKKSEWISLFLKAPFSLLQKIPNERIYVVEADCDRPGEGPFLSELLMPDIVLWLNSIRSHGGKFEGEVRQKRFESVEQAIAFEYGYFLQQCRELVMINGDSTNEKNQLPRTRAKVIEITREKYLNTYAITSAETRFTIENHEYSFKALLPLDMFYALVMTAELVKHLGFSFDETYSKFILPNGRSSLLLGIKGIKIIDSSYNANLSSMEAILSMYELYPAQNKWVVVGDMLEQGEGEKAEHEKLAKLLSHYSFSRIILLGPRVCKYTYPELKLILHDTIALDCFENPKEVLDFLTSQIRGEEMILFKGARFMEGIIERLLQNQKDVALLVRREEVWQNRRRKFGI